MAFSSLLSKYSATANDHGTDKTTVHSYGDLYDATFEECRSKADVCVLEIGIYSGAFLQAVAEFLPEAQVDGIDVSLDRVRFGRSNPRIRMACLDGTAAASVEALQRSYDVIIDDASHLPADQVRTLDLFAPLLKPGGVYMIEDINDATMEEVRREVTTLADRHGLELAWHDLRDRKGRYDDIMAVLRRPAQGA